MAATFLQNCPYRRLGKLMYLALVATCLVFVLIGLKFHSDIKTRAREAPDQEQPERLIRTSTESGRYVSDTSRDNHVSEKPIQNRSVKADLKSRDHFSNAITSNTSAFRITTGVSGKLGNQMFQYASLLGIAVMNKMLPFYTSSLLRASFPISHYQGWSSHGFDVVEEKDFATYDPTFEHLPQKNTLIMQYLQSWRYFWFISDIIRKEFTFKEEVRTAAQKLVNKHSAKIGNRTRVGIHVRRGDMNAAHEIRRGYHTAPASYVREAIDYMRGKHPNAIFLLVTDDVNWCRNNFEAPNVIFMDRAPAPVHLAVLASCDHVIMTVGTYGWWGGFLSGGEVVYYWDRKELLHDPPLPVEIKHPEDFFPPEWVPLSGV